MSNFKFGTDGIRGIVNKDLDVVASYKLGCALALYLKEENKFAKVVIGEDTRKSCAMLKCGLLAGLLSCGIDCTCLGIVTTPALAYITKKTKSNAGIMITASHNLSMYNGFKIFNKDGSKIDIKTSLILERYAHIFSSFEKENYLHIGTLIEDKTKIKSYISYLKRKTISNKFNVCFDCSNGTTNNIISKIFGKDKIVSGNLQDSELVNYKCGATDVSSLKEKVVQNGYDLGFAFDGDGDRVIAISSTGKVIDGDEILYIIANYLKNKGKLKHNTIVGTVVTNYGVERSLLKNGINLIRQQVGDKFISLEMKSGGYGLGGEQSGHIIIGGESTTGDGVLVAIILLNIMNELNSDLDSLTQGIVKFNQSAINVQIKSENKDYIMQNYEFNQFLSKIEDELSYSGRALVRPSGTENLIRILVEGENKDQCENIAKSIENKIIALNIG